MLCEEVGEIENRVPYTLSRLGVVSDDAASDFLQIQSGPRAESGPNHDRRRNSSVVRD
jgi:hypothetical protein